MQLIGSYCIRKTERPYIKYLEKMPIHAFKVNPSISDYCVRVFLTQVIIAFFFGQG